MPVMQTTRWCFTLNNPQVSYDDMDEKFNYEKMKFMIVGHEVAPTTLTVHLQGYIVFFKQKSLKAVREVFPYAHWEIAKATTAANVAYCRKDGLYHEYGVCPKDRTELAADSKERWADVIRSAKEGKCQEEYPAEWIRFNSLVTRLAPKVTESNNELCGIWYYGASGTGKSRQARIDYPGCYDKLLNKWWDNYEGEPFVLLDDLDHFHAPQMGSALKRYADHYPFRVEVKGSTMVIRPKQIIVTSQYTIEELWPLDTELQAALNRRFKTKTFRKL